MKFGSKKKAKPAGGGEKKAKRKGSRGSGDGMAKLKLLFANHIEKMLLAAIAVVALLLVYAGFSKEPLDTDPDKVRAAVDRAQSSINSPTWAQVKQERQPEPDRFDEQATQDTDNVVLEAYSVSVPYHPRMQEQSKRRSDPELFAPFELELRPGYGAIAIRPDESGSNISSMVESNSSDLRSLPSGFNNRRGNTRLGGNFDSRFFVAITGLVPYKKQFDAYQDAFAGAAEFSAERDVPQYLGLMIDRAEVQPDGSLTEWTNLDTLSGMIREPESWAEREEERASRDYVLTGLTMRLPPLALRDVGEWATHSSVPLLSPNAAQRGEAARVKEGGKEDDGPVSWVGGAAGERRSRTRSSDSAGGDEADYGEKAVPELKVENGMLRYFDFTAEPGKAYKYRVRALLDDPNNPVEGPKPSISSCETDVIVRRQSATEPFRRTPWSEPSPAVFVPTGQTVLASTAEAPGQIGVGPNRRVRIERKATDEPTIKVMTLTWKKDGPYDVPYQIEVGRGAVLNGRAEEVEAVDPTVGRVRKLSGYNYETDAMVLDIYGGFSLGGDLAAPGFMLIRTADGRLEFHTEMADLAEVEAHTIPPDEEQLMAAEEARAAERAEEERAEEEGGGRPRRRGGRERNSRGGR